MEGSIIMEGTTVNSL